jgi:hypothetical protein
MESEIKQWKIKLYIELELGHLVKEGIYNENV